MIGSELGLAHIPTKDLLNLLRVLHRGELQCPIRYNTLALAGVSYLHDKIGFLQGLEHEAVRSVLVAVLAERREST